MSDAARSPWRDLLPVHPDADLLPRPTREQLAELADDIAERGLVESIKTMTNDRGQQMLIDGISRMDAMYNNLGWDLFTAKGELRKVLKGRTFTVPIYEDTFHGSSGVFEYIISKNIKRRHLTSAQKRELIAKLLKRDPSKSDRAIGKMVGASEHTVAKVRSNAQIAHKDRTEASGRKARGRKPKSSATVVGPIEVEAKRIFKAIDDQNWSRLRDPEAFGEGLQARGTRILQSISKSRKA